MPVTTNDGIEEARNHDPALREETRATIDRSHRIVIARREDFFSSVTRTTQCRVIVVVL
jgi:hypothetical protein